MSQDGIKPLGEGKDWQCSEGGFCDFLCANPVLDGSADLQWMLHNVYWRNSQSGHRNAINACMRYAREHGVTVSLYTDPVTRKRIEQRDAR